MVRGIPLQDLYMTFKTYIVEQNPDKSVRFFIPAVIVGILALIILGAMSLYTIAGWVAGGVVGAILVFAVIKKGRIQAIILSKKELIITARSISIDRKIYDINKVKKLEFRIHSFRGMPYSRNSYEKETSAGMDNYVSFTFDNEEVYCKFYLNSKPHTLHLCRVFEEFYKNKVPFVEMDMSGQQTYLFKRLDGRELDVFKQKYGYK